MTDKDIIKRHETALKQSDLWVAEDGTAFQDSEVGLQAARKYKRATGRTFKKFKRLRKTQSSKKSKN